MSKDFRFSVDTFDHILGHVSKAAGKIHGLVGDADHIREIKGPDCPDDVAFGAAELANGKPVSVYIADLVICARGLAAKCPSGPIDIEKAVTDRMTEKKDYLAQYDTKK